MGLFDSFRRDKGARKAEEQSVAPQEESPLIVDEESAQAAAEVAEAPVETDAAEEDVPTLSDAAQEAAQVEQPVQAEEAPKVIKKYDQKARVSHTVGETHVVAIINQKGGVGKSTTAVNLSAALGELGKQVLLVDLDPQGNASSGLGVEKSQLDYCVYDALLNDEPLENIIVPDVSEGLDLVPATINLAGAEVELVSEMARENRLKDAIGRFRGKYDYIFIDCPPSLGLLTVNAFVASDALLIPIQCEFYALEGVTKLLDSMKRVKTRLNPSLEIFGVLLTMYDGRTILSKQVAQEVQGFFGEKAFETIIPRTVKLSEAPSYGQPITQFDPNGKGAQSYMNLAKEVIARGW
ncbi:MAG: AAA family ATPase [Coriobacteriia bacterium]|nr:AAA family ATPase [Coriobacteriia bacterium]